MLVAQENKADIDFAINQFLNMAVITAMENLLMSVSAMQKHVRVSESGFQITLKLLFHRCTIVELSSLYFCNFHISQSTNGPSKVCGRQPLKKFNWSILECFAPYNPSAEIKRLQL